MGRWPKNNDSKHRSPGKDAQNYPMPSSVASVVAEIKRGSPARRKLVEFSAVKLLLVHPVYADCWGLGGEANPDSAPEWPTFKKEAAQNERICKKITNQYFHLRK